LDYVVSRVLSEFREVLELPSNRLSRGFLPEVQGDPEQLYRLFKHLIGNAVSYRKKYVPLVVSINSFQGGNGVWHVLIKDNGIGFDNTDADRIFQPFVQLQPEEPRLGAGLGLTICRRIVQAMGGKISALSEKGEGTTIIITFSGVDAGDDESTSPSG
jgi:signal transduction histidine kinase